jgi:chemotaxis protein methyltransferase CheR
MKQTEHKELNLELSHPFLLNCVLTDKQFLVLSQYITSNIGIKLPIEKKIMLQCRLQKRLRALKFSSFDEYLKHLFDPIKSIDETRELFDLISTNKTDFFRENKHFDFLTKEFLNNRFQTTAANRELKVWSAGCSSGEEAITIAITLEEIMKKSRPFPYKIFATDISDSILKSAKTGEYHQDKLKDVNLTILRTYFTKSADSTAKSYFVKDEIKRKIQYEKLNFMKTFYPTPDIYDIIFCRNVLIYFDRQTQNDVLQRLINRLRKGGLLFIGHSESLLGMNLPLELIVPTVFRKI